MEADADGLVTSLGVELRGARAAANAGITTFSPLKPQRWVIASFEHHCGSHGLSRPHVHNVVIARLTTGDRIKLT